MKTSGLFLLFSLIILANTFKGENESPVELGKVNWLRDYEAAIKLANEEDKAILILFQEVPGCATCRNYGHNVLSNPLIVEAIEQYFIPLAIYNNKGGDDAKVLKQYQEPTWNNPVVRIVDEKGENLVDRLASNYSAYGLYQSMNAALEKVNQKPDKYFELLGEELSAIANSSIQESYYEMYCFWSGEGHLGSKDGVLSTEAGFMGGREVVKVKYDSKIISEESLSNYAAEANCKSIDKKNHYTKDKDPQYYLKHSNYKYLPLSPIQRSRINSAIKAKENPAVYLSPSQKIWLEEIEDTENESVVYYDQAFQKAWEEKKNSQNR